ncbi:MAG: redoxin domain-containing protein [Gammaproteobacteria bacterium]
MITLGSPVPEVRCEAYLPDGRIESISLADYRGRWIVLCLWPFDFTLPCQADLRAYSGLAHDFAVSGAVLLGASVDSAHAHRAWVRHALGTVHFPLLGDTARALTQGLGVLGAHGGALRSTFIVDPEGRIVSVSAHAFEVAPSAHETLRLLHALQAGELAASAWPTGEPFAAAA